MAAGKRELDAPVVEEVVKVLEHASRVPGMWLGNVTLAGSVHFLTGFTAGLGAAFDMRRLSECRAKVAEVRGYMTPFHSVLELTDQIHDRYPEESEAVIERFTVEFEAWKLLQSSTETLNQS